MPSTYCLQPTQSHVYSRYCHLSRKLPGGCFYNTDLLLRTSPEEFPTKKALHIRILYSKLHWNVFVIRLIEDPKTWIRCGSGRFFLLFGDCGSHQIDIRHELSSAERLSKHDTLQSRYFREKTWSTKRWLRLANSQICGFSPQVVEDIRQTSQRPRVLAYTPQSQATPTRRRKKWWVPATVIWQDNACRILAYSGPPSQASAGVKRKDATLPLLSSEAPNSADGQLSGRILPEDSRTMGLKYWRSIPNNHRQSEKLFD